MKMSMSVFGVMALVALGVTHTARADYWAWNGRSTSPSYWDDLSLWVRSGANTDFKNYNHNIMEKWSSGKAFADGWDKTITFRNASILSNEVNKVGTLSFSAGSPQDPIVFAAERDDYGIWSSANLLITGEDDADACLDIQSGTYRFAQVNIANTKDKNGTIKVGGGALTVINRFALDGALTLADNTTLAFNFSERSVTPVLVATNGVTVAGEVKVKVSATGKVRPVGGEHVLTTGGGFAGKTVTLVTDGLPQWMTGGNLGVNEDGDLVLSVVSDGTMLLFK